MDQVITIVLWVSGIQISWIAASIVVYISTVQRITRLEMSHEMLKDTFDTLGRKAIKLLHSPDDHLGLDRIVDEYIRREGELTVGEWERLLKICEEHEQKEHIEKTDKLLCVLGAAFARHKLKAFVRNL